MMTPPPIIPLGAHCRCICGVLATPIHSKIRRAPCTVYTLSQAFTCEIEVQDCIGSCSLSCLRLSGPDCRDLGLFNYNNRLLVAHNLLDEYTLAYSTSETPFTAWIKVITARYQVYSPSGLPFISEDTFRTIWFLYVQLVDFSNDMKCFVCGPEPEAVIFDGVTLAFSKKHLTTSLCPPTSIDESSPQRNSRYSTHQPIIKDKKLRSQLRLVVTGKAIQVRLSDLEALDKGSGSNPERRSNSDDSESEEEVLATKKAGIKSDITRLKAIPEVREQLSKVYPQLGSLFHKYCGLGRLASGRSPPPPYLAFFREVGILICFRDIN